MGIKVFDQTYEALSRALDLRTENQTVIASNIANADTPGYQAKELSFEKAMERALNSDDDPAQVRAEIHNQINDVVREDGNTVDRDSEMVSLAQNQLLYDAAADLVKKKLALLKYSITDGGNH
ncbi:MAG TPA: flagellar basal body rod protein FlgB [Bdellovibrionota bacterium]